VAIAVAILSRGEPIRRLPFVTRKKTAHSFRGFFLLAWLPTRRSATWR
jgi:hypothetical protein